MKETQGFIEVIGRPVLGAVIGGAVCLLGNFVCEVGNLGASRTFQEVHYRPRLWSFIGAVIGAGAGITYNLLIRPPT